MNKGIYIALSGAVLKQRNLDIFAQNIANANTSGYKNEKLSFKDHIIPVDNKIGAEQDGRVMADLSKSVIDFSAGILSSTGNPLDLAINGEGFFALEGDKYTRNGSFMIDSEGYLATKGGIKVLGEGGPVSVQGNSIDILSSGEIIVDGISSGKLNIVAFSDNSALKKISDGMFTAEETGTPATAEVNQGFLEGSNVNVIKEMVQMLAANREFESYQKMIQSFDEAASKTINELGR